ncbi:MAG: tyrosine-type recombinase/integrase, partial [Ignavibacteriota bacterium]
MEKQMATAKSLTAAELERVLNYITDNANAERNKLMLSFGVLAGLRVSEIAGLTLGDVLDTDGT